MFWALKAFFCSNIKSVLQSNFQLQAVKGKDAIYSFIRNPMAIKITRIQLYSAFNYTAILLPNLAYKVENNTIRLRIKQRLVEVSQMDVIIVICNNSQNFCIA